MEINKIVQTIQDINEGMGLRFVNESHRYFLGEQVLSGSVTKILGDFDFSKVPNIEYYQQIGTLMHGIAEDVANYYINGCKEEDRIVEEVPEYKNLVQNLEKLFKTYKPFLTEQIICIPNTNIDGLENVSLGGMMDLLCYKDNEDGTRDIIIMDYKTSSNIMATHKKQINIYLNILNWVYGIEIDRLILTKIDKKTGDIHLTQVPIMERDDFINTFIDDIKRVFGND